MKHLHDSARYDTEKPYVFKRTNNSQGAEKARKGAQVKIWEVFPIRRYDEHRNKSGNTRNAHNRILFYE